jgi:putative hydrolase of the HAD superfamily
MSGEFRAVIFDFYGTLTRAVHRGPAHDRVALALGCDPVAFGVALNQTYRARARGEYGDPQVALRRLAWRLGRSPTYSEVATAVRLRVAAIRGDLRLRSDVMPTLGRLRAMGLQIGLVTDCTDELPSIVSAMPVWRLIDAAVFSVLIGRSKPDPVMYQTICRRLHVKPEECLYIGDGDGRELSGARAARMTAVRLDAADLADHLVFDGERDWRGRTVGTIGEVIGLLPPAGREPALARSGGSMGAGPY